MQDLLQAHYQILSIIFLKKFLKLNVNMDTMIRRCETCEIAYKVCNCFLEYTNVKDDLIEYKCLSSKKNYQQKFHEKLKERFFNSYNFFNQITISLFYYCEKVFILMNTWMIEKNSIKHHYRIKKIFTGT